MGQGNGHVAVKQKSAHIISSKVLTLRDGKVLTLRDSKVFTSLYSKVLTLLEPDLNFRLHNV